MFLLVCIINTCTIFARPQIVPAFLSFSCENRYSRVQFICY